MVQFLLLHCLWRTRVIFKITQENIHNIKNKGLRDDAEKYVKQYENLNYFIKSKGIKISHQEYKEQEDILIEKLAKKGAKVCHNGKSIYSNSISPSCIDCHTGYGSATYIITLKCNRDCFFCTNKNQDDYAAGINKVYNILSEFKNHLKQYKKMKSVAITGGEPLLYPEECAKFISEVKKADESIQTRIYTNGDLVTEDIIKMLKNAGLDEIRFGLKPDENGNVSSKILENLDTANKYIKRTMVEMPFPLGKADKMKELMVSLNNIGIYSINILEFLYPFVHSDEYAKKGFEVKKHPYSVLYPYTYAGGVPVAGSSIECMEVMLYAIENNMKMGIHYCSLENKLTSQLYHANCNVAKSNIEYFSESDFFIKVAKGYGHDIDIIKNVLQENNKDYILYDDMNIIEFNPKDIYLLKNYDMELGLSYLAVDYDSSSGQKVMREYQIDKIEPALFNTTDI